eukprot:Gb_37742 [translate_table: standard]
MKLCRELNINIPLHLVIEWWRKGTFSQTQNEESTLLASHEDEDPKVPMRIFNKIIRKTIVDGGSSVNVIPSSTWEQLGKPPMNPTYHSIKLANQSKIRPIGVLQNVPVTVEGITVLQEFAVVEMTTNTTYVALIGQPWLYDTYTIQDWENRTFTLRGKAKTVQFPLVSHDPRAEKILDNPSDVASSTTISTEETASSYSENAYRAIHNPLIISTEDYHEPNEEGILHMDAASDQSESTSIQMLHWMEDAYEASRFRSCYRMKKAYNRHRRYKTCSYQNKPKQIKTKWVWVRKDSLPKGWHKN